MTAGSPRVEDQPPAVPMDVELYIEAELGRHDIALDGEMPESVEVIERLEAEYAAMDAEGVEPGTVADYEAVLACTASLILRGIKEHLEIVDEDTTGLPDEELQRRTGQSRLYADLIITGLAIVDWTERCEEPPDWQSEALAICGGIAFHLAEHLEGLENVSELAEQLREHAESANPDPGNH